MDATHEDTQAQLDALIARRRLARDEWDAVWKAENSRHDAEQSRMREKWKAENALIDAEVETFYQSVTGQRGFHEGDVVRAIEKYGDLQAGQYGIYEREYFEDERSEMWYVVLELEGGHISTPKHNVVVELDPDKAALFRFQLAQKYLKYSLDDKAGLREKLSAISAVVTGWLTRLDGVE